MEVKSRQELDKLVFKRQAERVESFKKLREEYNLDNDAASQAILQLDDATLLAKLRGGSLKATVVLKAYMAKALQVTDNCNCITEFIPQAKQWAEELDMPNAVKGPLHGLPIALKEDYDVEGMDSTLGFAKKLYQPAKKHAVLVKILRSLGAVPFAKTNVPQSLLSYACDNPIYGITTNPKNKFLSPGGSSGGSGAIMGGSGAVFSMGSDIGGSLRIPAHFNGAVTLRGTVDRLSVRGVNACIMDKLVGAVGVPGVIGNSASFVSLVYKELLKDSLQNKEDPRAVPIPWNDELYLSDNKLRIGYYTSLPFFPTIGDTGKTILDAKAALESLGHSVVEFQMPDDFHYIGIINALLHADGGKIFRELFHLEQIALATKGLVANAYAPEWKRKLVANMFPIFGGSSKRGAMLARTMLDARSSDDLWEKMYQKKLVRNYILDKMEEQELDLILCPVFPFPACKLAEAAELLFAVVYTMIWNIVDFPAGVLPFGVESGKNICAYDDEGDAMLKMAKESVTESAGMSIGVQLVAKPFKEELVLRVMTELEKTSKK